NLLLIRWGSLFGPVRAATKNILQEGYVIAHIHLRHLYPLPKDLGEIIIKFSQILVPEHNLGQLADRLRAIYLVDATPISKVTGNPFLIRELVEATLIHLKET
ncbi:MAG TPA: hypothetical protein QF423_04315, partial [Candidatus Scalindua sp.]|nr:hypothetical protein [Candidatus Scalindua sp.]